MNDVDVVVIGSGAGGMTAAVALARQGQRVLVLEQHYLPGGWCHSFSLGGHQWSPGVHYIGDLREGGRLRGIWEGLGVADDLVMLELNPDGYDHVVVRGERFDLPVGVKRLEQRLADRFPSDRDGIRRYLEVVGRMADELGKGARSPLELKTVLRHGLVPLKRTLDRFVHDPVLKTVLGAQSGDHGLPPSRVSTALHAVVQAHYFDGGWYPKGGGRAIPKAFIKELRAKGGAIRVRSEVAEIMVERGRAIGVRLGDGETIRSPVVISNADPATTWGRLVAREHHPWSVRARLRATRWSTAAMSLFAVIEGDLRAMGLDSGNYWLMGDGDVDDAWRWSRSPNPLARGDVPMLFVTVTSLKDPSKKKAGVHTVEAFTFVDHSPFARWRDDPQGERAPAYVALKSQLADRMIDRMSELIPDAAERVVWREVGSPLTNQFYVGAHRGNLYGTEKTLRHLVEPFAWGLDTPIGGLFQAGASTYVGHGVAGATASGLATAATVLGVRARELLEPGASTLSLLPCDAPEAWPIDLRPTRAVA